MANQKLNWVSKNLDRLKTLPAPDEEFTRAEADDRLHPIWCNLIHRNVLEEVDRRDYANRNGGDRAVYSVRPDDYALVQDRLDGRDRDMAMPCGDHGFRNVGDDRLDCPIEECDAGPWPKTAIEHYWTHGELPASTTTEQQAVATDGGTTESVTLGPLVTPDGERVEDSTPEQSWLPLPCGHRNYDLLDDDAAHWVECGECDGHYYRYEVLPDA